MNDDDARNHLLGQNTTIVDARDAADCTPLIRAAKNGHADAVRHLLKRGASPNAVSARGHTALHAAARGGHAVIVRLLLARGADLHTTLTHMPPAPDPTASPRFKNFLEKMRERFPDLMSEKDEPETPTPQPFVSGPRALMLAIRSGSAETVDALLEAGVDANAEIGPEMCPLSVAQLLGNEEIIATLLRHGAAVNIPLTGGVTPLHTAILRGQHDIVHRLLQAGADPNADGGTLSPLDFAVHQGDVAMVRLLTQFGGKPGRITPLDALTKDKPDIAAILKNAQGTAWHDAVKAGDTDAVRSALDNGAAVDARNEQDETALMRAAQAGHADLVQLLLDRGAAINAAPNQSGHALFLAIGGGHVAAAQALVERGANIDALNRWGHTPLSCAAIKRDREIVALLVAAGAKIRLVEAAALGDAEAVRRFLDEDNTPADYSDESGMTALMAAATHDEGDLANLLLDRGASVNARDASGQTALFYAATHGAVNAAVLLLDHGADINAQVEHDITALKIALLGCNEAMARLLLERGANIDGRSAILGETLLHDTVQMSALTFPSKERLPVVQLLLDYGLDVNARDKHGQTPLLSAFSLSADYPARPEVVGLLLQRGADPNGGKQTWFSSAPRDLAEKNHHAQIVRLLEARGAATQQTDFLAEITRLMEETGVKGPNGNVDA